MTIKSDVPPEWHQFVIDEDFKRRNLSKKDCAQWEKRRMFSCMVYAEYGDRLMFTGSSL